jgi:cation:H+ antiporter
VLYKASEVTIYHAVKVADVTGLGKTTIGFVLIAFSTSLPELFVVIFSVLEPQNVGVSIGNILGSNITNILFDIRNLFFSNSNKIPRHSQFYS